MIGLDFILTIRDAVLYLAGEGYDPLAVIAHAALESGWGTSELAREHKNLFGIKGEGVEYETCEVVNGETVVIKAKFRSYKSYEECARHYDILIKTLYPEAYKVRSHGIAYFLGICGKWATDPAYFAKLVKIYQLLLEGR